MLIMASILVLSIYCKIVLFMGFIHILLYPEDCIISVYTTLRPILWDLKDHRLNEERGLQWLCFLLWPIWLVYLMANY